MSKQLVFPYPMTVTATRDDGKSVVLRYGQYEAVLITRENGHPVGGTITLSVPVHFVTDVDLEDGTRLVFHEPFYLINKSGRGDV